MAKVGSIYTTNILFLLQNCMLFITMFHTICLNSMSLQLQPLSNSLLLYSHCCILELYYNFIANYFLVLLNLKKKRRGWWKFLQCWQKQKGVREGIWWRNRKDTKWGTDMKRGKQWLGWCNKCLIITNRRSFLRLLLNESNIYKGKILILKKKKRKFP